MKNFLKNLWRRETFNPSYMLGIWINPFFIIRKGLINGVIEISDHVKKGKLLDVGCGSKPYKEIFDVDEYIGIDIEVSGHDHSSSDIDMYYDGKRYLLAIIFLIMFFVLSFWNTFLILMSYSMK
jgi:hypothetical protein